MKANAITRKLPELDECPISYCNWSYIYSQRFGIDSFPCSHTVQKINVSPHLPPEFPIPIIQKQMTAAIYNEETWNFKEYSKKNSNHSHGQKIETNASFMENLTVSWPSYSFILKLTKEVISFKKLNENEINIVFSRLAFQWGKSIGMSQKDEEDIDFRSTFRFDQLRNFKLN
jgi:hypothetical protein